MFGIKKESEKGKEYIKRKYGVDVPDLDVEANYECVFSIYDCVCCEYNPPFLAKNINIAVRNLKDTYNNPKNQQSLLYLHPTDYQLRLIGFFDKETGELKPYFSEPLDGINYVAISSIIKKEVDLPNMSMTEREVNNV